MLLFCMYGFLGSSSYIPGMVQSNPIRINQIIAIALSLPHNFHLFLPPNVLKAEGSLGLSHVRTLCRQGSDPLCPMLSSGVMCKGNLYGIIVMSCLKIFFFSFLFYISKTKKNSECMTGISKNKKKIKKK